MSVKSIVPTYCPSFLKPLFERINNSPIGLRLAKGVFWSMTGSVISRGLMLCATVLVARMLGKTVYGELGIIQSTVGMFGVFAGFGLALTATKHVAEFRQNDKERAGRIIVISGIFAMLTGGLMALSLFIFAPWLAEHTINAPHLVGVLRVGALILFINALNGAQTGALSGLEAFKPIAYVNLFVGLISFPVLLCGAHFGGLTGTVWALTINLCFNWILNHIALRKELHRHHIVFTFRNCSQELPIIWNFAIPAMLAGIVVGPANWACRALLTNQPNGYDEMGVLTAALTFQVLLLFISNMLSAPLLSMVSNAGANISENFEKVNILLTWILGVIVAIPLLCFPEVALLLFGSDYATHSFQVTYSLIVFCTSIMTFKTGLTRSMVANDILWWGFFSNTLWAIIFIGSTVYFIGWGASGIAVSLSIAYILQTLVILPLLCARNLIPEGTLFSIESFVIWSTLVSLVFFGIVDVSFIPRVFAFFGSVLIVGVSFIRMVKGNHCKIVENQRG